MTSNVPALTDPDKLGLLIQCRQKMDELNANDLNEYANSTIKMLSPEQLKSLLFVGLNHIKNNISYNQFIHMKASINEIIEQAKKLQNMSKPNANQSENKSVKEKPSVIPIVPKKASLTKTIPFDIISNHICQFLKMSSITKLAQCDRKLAIICHTPISVNNLMHRYDMYKYDELLEKDTMIDGYYLHNSIKNCDISNLHRFKNIERLSLDIEYFNSKKKIPTLNSFPRVKHLAIFDIPGYESCPPWDCPIQIMPLQTISFINTCQTDNLIYFLKAYKNVNTSDVNNYYNKIIYQLTSIAFIDCKFTGEFIWDSYYEFEEAFKEYKNIVNFILPSQQNRLQVLKLENSCFEKTTDHTECDKANDEFENLNRIKTALSNLKGFVYQQPKDEPDDVFFNLAENILRNLTSFKNLESIHTHSLDSRNQLISLYLNNDNRNVLSKITEFCVSILINQWSTSKLCDLKILMPNLEKLCLVIDICDSTKSSVSNFQKLVESILKIKTLKLFQIVAVIKDTDNTDSKFCENKLEIVTAFTKSLVKVFQKARDPYISTLDHGSRPLLFKLHVKSSHTLCDPIVCVINGSSDLLEAFSAGFQNMTVHYLMTFPLGKIQFKYSTNVPHCNVYQQLVTAMRGTEKIFNVITKEGGSLKYLNDNANGICYTDMDFKQYAVSVQKNNNDNAYVEYMNNWKVDCRYCCNTPWV